MPQSPYPVGTYYAVETEGIYQIRQIGPKVSKNAKHSVSHYSWSERILSVHKTKEDAKKALIRLVTTK